MLVLPVRAQVPATFAITNARVFDGERVLSKATVVVSNGRIQAVGAKVRVPAGAQIIKAGGKTLLPGFIDAHVHTFGASREAAVRFGVTAELDMFSDWRALREFKRDRDSATSNSRSDVYSAGTLVTAPGGHGTEFGLRIATLERAEDAARFIDDRLSQGSDFIKVVMEEGTLYGREIATLSRQSVQAVIQAAKAREQLVVVHVSAQSDALFALRAGADGLVHVFQDQPVSAEFIELAKRRRAFVIPTLSVIEQAAAGSGPQLASDARLQPMLLPQQRDTLKNVFPSRANTAQLSANAMQSVRKLQAARVPILAGTDAGNPGTAHGASLHGELTLLVAAGLTPVQALAAATSQPARHFRLADRGRIAPGMRADLVLVEGDPTTSIEATRAIVSIWKNGSKVDRRPVLPKAPRAPAVLLLSDFDTGKPAAAYGLGWQASSDQLIGGNSTAVLDMVGSGAQGTHGALQVSGEIKAGSAYRWAGALCVVGESSSQVLDYSARRELVFWAKGDRPGVVMLYSGTTPIPAIVSFAAATEWREHRVALQSFTGASLEQVRAVMFAATDPPGVFRLVIDQVEIR
jgi:imidazolonepropionase-like amidohydrolase